MWLLAVSYLLALAAALALVPLIRAGCRAIGMVDHPDAERKLHREPIALGGGIAVYLAFVFAFVATVLLDRWVPDHFLGRLPANWRELLLAAAAMLCIGVVDDHWTLRGRQKLFLQCLIVAALIGGGTVIDQISLFGIPLELGVFAYPLTIVWLLGAINALNLIDGADGMATTAGGIICLGLGFLSFETGNPLSAVVGFALAGALSGFLVFNRPPATIYLGDAGSMTVGLIVGVLAIWSHSKESTLLASAPIAILAIPLLDSTAAILRRSLTGRSIYATDRAHLHHLLQEKFGDRQMLFFVAALCATTTAAAFCSVRFQQPWLAGLGVLIVLCLLIVSRSFGHAECRLLFGRASHLAQSLIARPETYEPVKHKQVRKIPLQGSANWDTIWEPLIEFAKSHELDKLKMDLNLAWLHEGYHGNWQSIRLPEKAMQINVSIPLFARRPATGERVGIGRLDIIAAANEDSVYDRIASLSDILGDLAPEIDRIVANLESQKGRKQPVVEQEFDEVETAGDEVHLTV